MIGKNTNTSTRLTSDITDKILQRFAVQEPQKQRAEQINMTLASKNQHQELPKVSEKIKDVEREI